MQEISLFELLVDASLGVKLVLLVLFFMSVYSWGLIIRKTLTIGKQKKDLSNFNKNFWESHSIYQAYKNTDYKKSGFIGAVFKNAASSFLKTQKDFEKISKDRISEIIVGDFEVNIQDQEQLLNKDINTLATISSTSPYIGLLGTVYGILVAFWGLGLEQGATIAEIAPSIAEALIATAMGLFVAIPALMAHNRFKGDVSVLKNNYLKIEDEVVNMINKSYLQKYKEKARR